MVLVSGINVCFFVYLSSSFFIICVLLHVLLHVVDVLQEQCSGGDIACCHGVFQVRCQACLAFRNLASEGTHTFNHMYSYVYIVKV